MNKITLFSAKNGPINIISSLGCTLGCLDVFAKYRNCHTNPHLMLYMHIRCLPRVSRLIFDPFLTLKTYLEIKIKFLHGVFCIQMILQDSIYHIYPANCSKNSYPQRKMPLKSKFCNFSDPRVSRATIFR